VYSQEAVSVWGTGLSGGAPDSVRWCRLPRTKWPLSGIRRRRTAKIHRTVRCAPDCPVSQRSAGPTVGRAICAGHVAKPTVGRGHRTVRCAPDCPVVHRTVSGAPGCLERSGRSREFADDVRLKFTGLSSEPTVGRANGRLRDLRGTRGRANGRKGALDCPVCTRHVRCANGSHICNGRLHHFRKEIGHRTVSGVHRTVRCASRQKARSAFLDCSQQLLAALGL
jgi:hypothetical protein